MAPRDRVTAGKGKVACLILALLAGGCAAAPPPDTPGPQFLNQDPEVAYVGRDACKTCHFEIYSSFLKTGMGRAFTTMSPAMAKEDFSGDRDLVIAPTGMGYKMTTRDGHYYQRQFILTAEGQEWLPDEREIRYILGSGNHSRSYVTLQDDRFLQMPVCWYPDEQLWDLCPGYEKINKHFRSTIPSLCVFCHNGRMTASPEADNAFLEPIPNGIGCERCHGPGALHVQKWREGDTVPTGDLDPTIVNPRRLPVDQRLQVCFQCHLGDSRAGVWVMRIKTPPEDWRPGQDLQKAIIHFRYKEPLAANFGISSQADRLMLSRCFKASEGKLECLTCHNPHVSVYRSDRPDDFFNAQCIGCHRSPGCSEAPERRRQAGTPDDCVRCHMRQAEPDDHPHTLFTDHWIRRRLPADDEPAQRTSHELEPVMSAQFSRLGQDQQAFALGRAYLQMTLRTNGPERTFMRREAERHLRQALDSGLDTAEVWYQLGENLSQEQRWAEAESAFRTALERDPAHKEAALDWAEALVKLNRTEKAVPIYTAVLNDHPDNDRALAELGRLALTAGKPLEALRLMDEAVAMSPWTATHHANRAMALARLGRSQEALRAAQRAATLNPEAPPIWDYYAELLRRAGRLEESGAASRRGRDLEQRGAEPAGGMMGGS
ncbi:MAG: tetratricopeptide repeat protein [Acidobacteria bacterium]|nr:tetratricopeptide repeat protein [Acidobacteriota bacterium]